MLSQNKTVTNHSMKHDPIAKIISCAQTEQTAIGHALSKHLKTPRITFRKVRFDDIRAKGTFTLQIDWEQRSSFDWPYLHTFEEPNIPELWLWKQMINYLSKFVDLQTVPAMMSFFFLFLLSKTGNGPPLRRDAIVNIFAKHQIISVFCWLDRQVYEQKYTKPNRNLSSYERWD